MLRRSLGVVAFVVFAGSSGCTLAKPVVGVVTGPVVLIGHSNGHIGAPCGDASGIVVALVVMAVSGAVGGLVTGVISDVHALSGAAADPAHNWWDPFKTNTSN
jgi:tRNA A37 threonylcarbamoyltransferase TsaD